MAADLVRRNVAVLVSTGGAPSVIAAKAATATIPIVFTIGTDPIRLGFVTSLSRPGGNVTGVNLFATQMESKRLGLLRALIPGVQLIAVLLNPNQPNYAFQLRDIQEPAAAIGLQIHILLASKESEFDAAFATAVQLRAGAMLVSSDPFFNSQRDKIIALAARYSIPAIYEWREFALAGGLMSYGTNISDGYRQAGVYAGRILKGEKPADLPGCSRPDLNSSSTSRQPRRSALRCRRTSPPRRTRSLSKNNRNVRYWHKADIPTVFRDGRATLASRIYGSKT